jgi:Cu/Ag efflux protein CusF
LRFPRERALGRREVVSMSKVFNVAAAVAILSAATAAFAADTTHRTTGRIKSVDLMQHVITLESGSTYKAARGVDIERMKPGEMVTVTTSGFGGTVEASSITPAIN